MNNTRGNYTIQLHVELIYIYNTSEKLYNEKIKNTNENHTIQMKNYRIPMKIMKYENRTIQYQLKFLKYKWIIKIKFCNVWHLLKSRELYNYTTIISNKTFASIRGCSVGSSLFKCKI